MNVDERQRKGLLRGITQVDIWRKSIGSHSKEEITEFDKEKRIKGILHS